ncbi:uncharacterized protein LOC106176045 [Lingula anatina]|uniref:Uncharacterized protein LOC106154075 n=1 Tax=Lingula anatina TaxID=7574 RepID=A0A1S3JTP0_LINAN|nr:uncharacterized protein LOC106154075 [Lingula anatina]XP_013413712.1 uncharacterized protein LOC106176045 [Lingula anatina]|eukprot:XP_013383770.1 uncharacterized protein LOC106154075 [Lingula anatina]
MARQLCIVLAVLIMFVDVTSARSVMEEKKEWRQCFCPRYEPYNSICPSEYHCYGVQCECVTCGCNPPRGTPWGPYPTSKNTDSLYQHYMVNYRRDQAGIGANFSPHPARPYSNARPADDDYYWRQMLYLNMLRFRDSRPN